MSFAALFDSAPEVTSLVKPQEYLPFALAKRIGDLPVGVVVKATLETGNKVLFIGTKQETVIIHQRIPHQDNFAGFSSFHLIICKPQLTEVDLQRFCDYVSSEVYAENPADSKERIRILSPWAIA